MYHDILPDTSYLITVRRWGWGGGVLCSPGVSGPRLLGATVGDLAPRAALRSAAASFELGSWGERDNFPKQLPWFGGSHPLEHDPEFYPLAW